MSSLIAVIKQFVARPSFGGTMDPYAAAAAAYVPRRRAGLPARRAAAAAVGAARGAQSRRTLSSAAAQRTARRTAHKYLIDPIAANTRKYHAGTLVACYVGQPPIVTRGTRRRIGVSDKGTLGTLGTLCTRSCVRVPRLLTAAQGALWALQGSCEYSGARQMQRPSESTEWRGRSR